jgi:predicted  nucleic acid-binding Zn-ribbon protein
MMFLGVIVPKVEISFGEVADKWTILEIKCERLVDQSQIRNVMNEKLGLKETVDELIAVPGVQEQLEKLLATNRTIWDQMDEIYELKKTGPRYSDLTFEITVENQRRAFLKREIDRLMNSEFHEEKSYFVKPNQVVIDGD